MPISIAIDGPAGAGKSTISRKVAILRNMTYLDTGAMYRACALKAIRLGVSCTDQAGVDAMLQDTDITIDCEGGRQVILLDGEDVSGLIRTPEISKGSSDISAVGSVRLKMVDIQRKIAKGRDVILDGRDIGTFVLPDATIKIYLTASVEERAQRRYAELAAKGGCAVTFEEVKKDIENRDYNDSHRVLAPLKKAEDAIEIDTTSLTIEQSVDKIIAIVDSKC
ncbi:MAG: (d)CMP kinase [Saccharofermentanales bacterium]